MLVFMLDTTCKTLICLRHLMAVSHQIMLTAHLAQTNFPTCGQAVPSFTLQPGLYAGYTWIQSGNYTSVSGDHVSSDNLNVFEISPALRAIKQISNGWFGSAHVRYVATTVNGGDSVINSNPAIEFDSDNFTEYGLTIEKSIDRFNIMATITRRDGARDGFGGGLNLRYIF